ncbi:MAG: hypothetical protein KJN64_02905 [Ignavibacteria bacterium]|nr:hypothetical protein [Ignavibacteria bacterium]MBT8382318.1 hypothetical protein [Ignavibacteria bacterium]MBT8391946.1 hypothetical protein [Ignavibacteria bacterium]NNJ52191.1 hypothetical protein [Ignavibacteriaceae bacterium]NNL21766.1 hypothetical protein [Ignavibacteriaceae bacterium]
MKIKGLVELILGLWLLVSAFLGFDPNGSVWNYFIVGVVLVGVSFFLIHGKPRQSWIAGVLGFWLIIIAIAPFIVSGMGIYLNNIIVGLLITTTGFAILVHGRKHIHHLKKMDKHLCYRNYGSE